MLHSPFRRICDLRILTDRTLSQAEQSALGRRHPTAEIALYPPIDSGNARQPELGMSGCQGRS